MELKNYFAQDDAGNVLAGATCYLYEQGTEILVTGLLKANGTALGNPFNADPQGLVQFAAPTGLYDLRVVSDDRDYRIVVQCNDVQDPILEEKIADDANLVHGAGMVGYRGRSVAAHLGDRVSARDVQILSDLDEFESDKFIPAGSYAFAGANIESIGDIEVSLRASISNAIYAGIVQQDAGRAWLQHNHLEFSAPTAPYPPVSSGNVPPAPLYSGPKQDHTQVLAYWYQDFGLEATRAAAGAIGSTSWYYWSWLFHGAAGDGHQAERHPWLGYYRGDDPHVLDWQCYWLNEAGVSGVIPQTRGNGAKYGAIRANWANPADENHWMYQLFNNAPNFKQLTYVLWAWSGGNTTADKPAIEASFDELIAIYQQFPNFAFVKKNGGIYPIVFAFEGDFWRGAYDNYVGQTNTRTFLIAQANKFKAAGFSGFAVLARNSSGALVGDRTLEAGGVLYLDGEYSVTNYTPALNGGLPAAVDYEDLAIGAGTRPDGATFPYRYVVPNIMTSRKSHSAHPSTFNHPGSTPALFELMCRNVLRRMSQNGNPRILTVYNVSEWAEGGPALQPNMRDGKGYLAALKNALASAPTELTAPRLFQRQADQFLSAPSVPVSVDEGATTVPLTVSYAWTSTAAPVISDPLAYNGKRVRLMLSNASGHSGPITLEDIGTRAASGLRLTAATIALGKNDSVELEYDVAQAVWIQVSPVANVL